METVKKLLADIYPSAKNVRKHNSAQLEEFKRSIRMFGQIRPIVIDENGRILAGNGLYAALISMGYEEAECLVKKGLSESQKNKLMLADNKVFALGIDNYETIDEIMKQLASEGDFDIPGYDANTLDELYGIKSVESSAQEIDELPFSDIGTSQQTNTFTPVENPVPSRAIMEAREEAQTAARRFVICPNCGERIELDD